VTDYNNTHMIERLGLQYADWYSVCIGLSTGQIGPRAWCELHCSGSYSSYAYTYWFELEADAMMFRIAH